MQSALDKLAEDSDLTLMIANQDESKNLNVLLPYLFKTSLQEAAFAQTQFYDSVLEILLTHLKKRQDPSLEMLGAVSLMSKVVEMEPNVNKRLVTQIFEEIRQRMES